MIALRAARVLAEGEERRDWHVTIDGDRIVAVGRYPGAAVPVLDLGDADLVPGLVDLHSDCLEERAHPRPGREQPLLSPCCSSTPRLSRRASPPISSASRLRTTRCSTARPDAPRTPCAVWRPGVRGFARTTASTCGSS